MFRMTVDDVFSFRGRGTVVMGTIEEGMLRVGDEVLINREKQVRVDGIEAFRKVLDHAEKGQIVGVLFAKLDRSEVIPGDLVSGVGDTIPADTPAIPADAPPQSSPTSTTTSRDRRFAQLEEQRGQLQSMRQTGLMDEAQIDDALRALTFTVGGRRWALRSSGAWYSSSDGRDWSEDTPPG